MTKLLLAHSYPKDTTDYRGRFILDYMLAHPDELFIVVAPHPHRSFIEKKENYEVHYFHWKHRLLGGMEMYNPLHHFILLKMIFLFYFSAKRVLKRENISAVFACWAIPGGIVAWLLKVFHTVHYSVWLLGTDVNKFIKVPLLLRTICNGADAVFANSGSLKQKIAQVTQKNVDILLTRSLLPTTEKPEDEVAISSDNFNVAFVGRLEMVKGIDRFLAIAEKVREVRDDARFFIFGDGSLAGMVQKAEDDGTVVWGGEVSLPTLSYYAEFIDVLLITSRNESMPVVFWEFEGRTKILSFPVGDIPTHLAKECIMETVDDFVRELTPSVPLSL